jgi:predicted DNA-binding transcriptional regulator AlpA
MEIIKAALMCSTAQSAPAMRSPTPVNKPEATRKRPSTHRDLPRKAAARRRPQLQHRDQDSDDDSDDGEPAAPDELVPDPAVCREFGIVSMTLWRWTRDKELQFPPAVQIRGRNFRSRRQLQAFKERMIRAAVVQRDREEAVA